MEDYSDKRGLKKVTLPSIRSSLQLHLIHPAQARKEDKNIADCHSKWQDIVGSKEEKAGKKNLQPVLNTELCMLPTASITC